MKKENLKNLSKDELLQKEKTLKEELFKLNQERFAGRAEKPHRFSQVRKEVARVETLLNEKKDK